jgi:hypothetical protein
MKERNSWEEELIRLRDWEERLMPVAPEVVEKVKALEDRGFMVCVVEPGAKLVFESGSSSSSIAWLEKSWWVVCGKPIERQVGIKNWRAGTAGGSFIQTEVTMNVGDAIAEEVWDSLGMELRIRRRIYVAVP